MDLGLTSRGRYVVRAAIFLAGAYGSGHLRTRREVSEAMGVPRAFVPQVLSDLIRSGLVVSTPGAHGGYRLARPPDEVRLLDVVEAGEGPVGGVTCGGCGSSCPDPATCGLPSLWQAASTRFADPLARTTLAELVERGAQTVFRGGRLPCGVLAASRRAGAGGGAGGLPDGLAAEQVGEVAVERFADRVGATAALRRRHGGHEEDGTIGEDGEQ